MCRSLVSSQQRNREITLTYILGEIGPSGGTITWTWNLILSINSIKCSGPILFWHHHAASFLAETPIETPKIQEFMGHIARVCLYLLHVDLSFCTLSFLWLTCSWILRCIQPADSSHGSKSRWWLCSGCRWWDAEVLGCLTKWMEGKQSCHGKLLRQPHDSNREC